MHTTCNDVTWYLCFRWPLADLVVNWTPARWACWHNVTTYLVDVKTSSSALNHFVDLFGRMPQDVCAADSKVRATQQTGWGNA